LSLVVLAISRSLFPDPRNLEAPAVEAVPVPSGLPSGFWIYLAAMALMGLGFADFNLISFHLLRAGDPSAAIPLLYALAMGTAAVSGLFVGRWFDRLGLPALAFAALLSAFFAPLAFLGNLAAAAVGVALWGIGMGIQDSLMSAPISAMVHADRRANAFGIFNAIYGVAWFVGSALMGALYGVSLGGLVLFSVAVQIAAVLVLLASRRQIGAAPKRVTR
jgi:MFS family permease